jgi:Tol biopolymer transport system component
VLVALAILALGTLAIRQLASRPSVTPVEYRKLTFRRGPIRFARFAGAGHAVYYEASWEAGRPEIYSRDLDSPGALKLGAPDSSYFLAASPSNELALLLRYRGRPHDLAVGTLARMAPGGAPREILDNVAVADWSPDGTDLAVVHVVGNRFRVEYPIGTVLYESPGWVSHLRVSPDGKGVAFLDHPVFPDDRGSVWVASAGKRARQLGKEFASTQGLAWSPSGKEILFAAATLGATRSIFAVDLRGNLRVVASLPGTSRVQDVSASGDVLITSDDISVGIMARAPGEAVERDLSWLDWSLPSAFSRDGRILLFSEEAEGGGEHYSVCIRGTDGSPAVRLGDGTSEDLSPDGAWALTTRFWLRPPELWLLPTGPGQPRKVPPTGLENIVAAGFFPSGEHLLVIGNEPGHGTRAYVHQIEGGPLRPITPEGIYARRGNISPDGKWIVGTVRGGDAYLYPVDGGSPREVSGKRPEEMVGGWSADGKSLYVSTFGHLPSVTYRLTLGTGARARWAELKGPDDQPGTTIGISVLGRDDHTYAYTYSRYVSELYLVRGLR